jgi:hypothetical protein
VRSLLVTFGPDAQTPATKSNTSTTTTSRAQGQPTTATSNKRRQSEAVEGKKRRDSDDDDEGEDNERERAKRARKEYDDGDEVKEEGEEKTVRGGLKNKLLTEARTMYEGGSWAGLMAFLPRLAQLDEDAGLAQVKRLMDSISHRVPLRYAQLFPPDNSAALQRARRDNAAVMDELVRLSAVCACALCATAC